MWLPALGGPLPAVDVLAGAAIAEPGGRPVDGGDYHHGIGPKADGRGESKLAVGQVSLGDTCCASKTAARGGGDDDGRPAPGERRRGCDVSDNPDIGQFGVYVHVPFCTHRCDYCAFATWTDRAHLIGEYLAAVGTDVRRAVDGGMPPATSVFVGGGTPSLVPADELAEVIAAIPVVPGAEVTVGVQPRRRDRAPLVATYVDAEVDRISIGVQSVVPHVLAALGRVHDGTAVRDAVGVAHASGLRTFNLDVIYGAAGERLADWRTTVEAVIELDPPHVSAYALTVEAGTPLAADPARHPDDDVQADCYELADDLLGAAGWCNYEVSNWARPGHECRHNELYWSQGDYRGFGCVAHSHHAGRRWWNVRTPERYVAAVAEGRPTEAAGESLDGDTRRIEGLQLALRTQRGVPVEALDGDESARWSSATTTGGCSPGGVGCWPTRCRCGCGDW